MSTSCSSACPRPGVSGRAVVALLCVLSALASASAAFGGTTSGGPELAISNVKCLASGYQFTVAGTGFPASSAVYVFIADNVYSGTGQFLSATTDPTGAFTVLDDVAGPGQELPATVTVGDRSYLASGGTSGTLYPVAATVTPPDCSTVAASPSPVALGAVSTITLQTIDPATGLPLGSNGAGRAVRFSTSLGTFPGNCTAQCLATDNGDGTYSLPLTSTDAGTATVTATMVDPAYGSVAVPSAASVTFVAGPPPAPDLAVSATTMPAGATSFTAGSSITYAITVTNHGNADAPGVTLNVTTGGAAITSLSATGATCNASTGTCSLGTIPAGGTVLVSESVAAASTAGTVTNSATVATTGAETDLVDNTAAAPPVTIVAPAPPPGSTSCTAAGVVLAAAHWSMQTSSVVNRKTVVQKHDVYGSVDAVCGYDPRTHKLVLAQAAVFVSVDGAPVIQAVTMPALGRTDVTYVALSGADATVAGVQNGTPFTITLHDGGFVRGGSDTVRVQTGSLDTSTLTCPHAGVLIVD